MKEYPSLKENALLLVAAFTAILIHGYHPGVEDAEIYLPGIKKILNASLYSQNAAFFLSHSRMTLFPNLIAASVRVTHLRLDWVMFLWHWFSIWLLLLSCWHLGRVIWTPQENQAAGVGCTHVWARWGGIALVAALLTIPAAGTALYIMDEYVTTRSLSAPAVVFIVLNALERKYSRSLLWAVATALIHPLMVVFGVSLAVTIGWLARGSSLRTGHAAVAGLALFPLGLFPPVTEAYREVLNSRPYFFLLRWHWYEWLGIFAPLVLLWWFSEIAGSRGQSLLPRLCRALITYQLFFFVVAVLITVPAGFARYAELQPMRSLHLLYVVLFCITGGMLARFVLGDRLWRWALLFCPLLAGMWFAQVQLFPATPHLEWPGAGKQNTWVQAFLWIRENTPEEAYFALDPQYMAAAGEDQHGFRAIAERSRMADEVKDSGAVTMFPNLAERWREQVQAERGWGKFDKTDFERLKQQFGVGWIVVNRPAVPGLSCPYSNASVTVCRVE